MSWKTGPDGITRWTGGTFPDPPDYELLHYGYTGDGRCGSVTGYRRHQRDGSTVCEPCQIAHETGGTT